MSSDKTKKKKLQYDKDVLQKYKLFTLSLKKYIFQKIWKKAQFIDGASSIIANSLSYH